MLKQSLNNLGESLPPLGRGEIHVWHFGLDVDPGALPALRALLDDTERGRADRFYRAIHGNRFTVGRATLRRMLAGYTGASPEGLAFTYGPDGKPGLHPDAHPDHVCFNLSHSGDFAACAVRRERAVGLDIEMIRPSPDFLKIARRFFAPDEAEQLEALPAGEQLAAFYQCWTAKEALVKAWGQGLSAPLDQFSVRVAPRETALLRIDFSDRAAEAWQVRAIAAPPGFACALASEGPAGAVRVGSITPAPWRATMESTGLALNGP